jgi:hypothetical protein
MGWRDKYRVHPATDVFPMMSDEELAALGEDIKANGLKHPITFCWVEFGTPGAHRVLLDGRNRLEAIERAKIVSKVRWEPWNYNGDPVAYVISANIRRRHLTKQQQADLIVAAIKAGEKPPQVEEVFKGGRGKVNETKAKAVAAAAAHGISESTVERAFAKAEGKTPKPKKAKPVEPEVPQELVDLMDKIAAELKRQGHPGAEYCQVCIWDAKQSKAMGGDAKPTVGFWATMPCQGDAAEEAFNEAVEALVVAGAGEPEPEPRPDSKPPLAASVQALERARREYLVAVSFCLGNDLDAELDLIREAFIEIVGKRAATLPQDGRSEVVMDDPAPELASAIDDVGDIPPALDRRKHH